MTTFTIDPQNNITAFGSTKEANDNPQAARFSSSKELGRLAEHWPGSRLVEIWNTLPGVEPVQRFTSKPVAVKRIWKAIQHLEPARGTGRPQVRLTKGSARKKASPATLATGQPNTKAAQEGGSNSSSAPSAEGPPRQGRAAERSDYGLSAVLSGRQNPAAPRRRSVAGGSRTAALPRVSGATSRTLGDRCMLTGFLPEAE